MLREKGRGGGCKDSVRFHWGSQLRSINRGSARAGSNGWKSGRDTWSAPYKRLRKEALRKGRGVAIPAKKGTDAAAQFKQPGDGVFPPGEKEREKVFTEVKRLLIKRIAAEGSLYRLVQNRCSCIVRTSRWSVLATWIGVMDKVFADGMSCGETEQPGGR